MNQNELPTEANSMLKDYDGSAFYSLALVASLTVVVGIIVLLALVKSR